MDRNAFGLELLRVRNLKVYYPTAEGILQRRGGWIRAVDDVSFSIQRGETLSLVGESGCGKTSVGRAILQLVKPTSGQVIFNGMDLVKMSGSELRRMRREMQIIFQDPFASLNPRMTVGQTLNEPLQIHGLGGRSERRKRVEELLQTVGLNPAFTSRYPHEFSGGQRQRIGIARALAGPVSLVVCDEPISALDVSIRAQIANLLQDLQERLNLSYLFIAHDLTFVRHLSSRVVVMYLGRFMEIASRDALYREPLHPYTVALLSAVPIPDPAQERNRRRIILTGDVPSPANPPAGCSFHPRCWLREKLDKPERCRVERPELRQIQEGHFVACHFAEEVTTGPVRPTGVPHRDSQIDGRRAWTS